MARKEKNIHYIYKTTCDITCKYYVGMHSTSNEDDGYMGSGKRLRYSIRKYGVENHTKEILSYHDSRELLIEAEISVITPDMLTDKNCMNLREGGLGGFSNEEHKIKFLTEGVKNGRVKTNEKLKERFGNDEEWLNRFNSFVATKAWTNSDYRDKILSNLDWKNKTHSEETKLLMSEQRKGNGSGESNSQYGTCWITNGTENKKIKKTDDIPQGWSKGRK